MGDKYPPDADVLLMLLSRESDEVTSGSDEASAKVAVIVHVAHCVASASPLHHVGGLAGCAVIEGKPCVDRDRAFDALDAGHTLKHIARVACHDTDKFCFGGGIDGNAIRAHRLFAALADQTPINKIGVCQDVANVKACHLLIPSHHIGDAVA